MSRGRRTLADYNPAVQGQILAAIHPPKLSHPAQQPATIEAKAPVGVTVASCDQRPAKAIYPFTICLSYRVPSLNTISGRWGKVKANRVAKKALAVVLAVTPSYPRQPIGTRLHVIYTSYVCQLRDADNPTTKFLNDAFRAAGLLRNDDPSCMALTVNPEVRVRKRALEGTRVTFVEALV